MNLTQQKIEEVANKYAQRLLEQAILNEPEITEDLQEIASEVLADIVGLEQRFKTVESLTQKLVYKAQSELSDLIFKDFSENDAIEKAILLQSEDINDVLRYTFVFSTGKYVFGFRQTLTLLASYNYKIPKDRIWNAWKNIGTYFDRGYRAINITIISSQLQKFELQFHTEESFRLKRRTHQLYKEIRSGMISQAKKRKLVKKLVEMAKQVNVPKGVIKL